MIAREAPVGRQVGGADGPTIRLGAVALPLAIILFFVSTALHPSRAHPLDNPAIFTEYSQSDIWVADHFAQWLAVLLLFAGFLGLYYAIRTISGLGLGLARVGFGAAVLTTAAFTALQAVDGVALKWAVDAWASAPAAQKTAAFAAAQAVRWTEYGFQSYSNILLGLTLALYGLAMALGAVFPRWLGWLAIGSGVAWVIHGVMVPYVGFFDSVPRLVAIVLMGLWAFVVAVLMWRRARTFEEQT